MLLINIAHIHRASNGVANLDTVELLTFVCHVG